MGSIRIGILVTGQTVKEIERRRGDFDRFIREASGRGPTFATYDVRSAAPMPRRVDADAFVITGSSSSVTERAPWILRVEELVRTLAASSVQVLGICFGHQIIAQALGGVVAKNPRGREIGTVRVERVADDPLFAGLPRAFDVNATHVDAVGRLPPGAVILATTALDPVAAFRVGERTRAVQFHPEFDRDIMRGYLDARAHSIRAEGGNPVALRERVHPLTRGRDILRNFVRLVSQTA